MRVLVIGLRLLLLRVLLLEFQAGNDPAGHPASVPVLQGCSPRLSQVVGSRTETCLLLWSWETEFTVFSSLD